MGKHSKELRDLYERGAEIKGDTLIIPAEEYEIPDERDHIRVINISHAFEKIRNPKTAVEFHSLARAIAGETADIGTEIEVFKHYYDLIERDAEGRRLDRHGEDYERERAAALDRTLAEMRLLAERWRDARRERASTSFRPSRNDLTSTGIFRIMSAPPSFIRWPRRSPDLKPICKERPGLQLLLRQTRERRGRTQAGPG